LRIASKRNWKTELPQMVHEEFEMAVRHQIPFGKSSTELGLMSGPSLTFVASGSEVNRSEV
jgi:hypothetical protein